MLHPIFSTVLGHPDLIAAHITNYAALVRQEASEATRGIVARLIAGVLAAVSAILALGLIGIAIMLGTVNQTFHWALVAVPGVAVLIAIVAATIAARPASHHGFDDLRAQVDADLRALRMTGRRDEE